jgi:hypothetical protein
MPLSTITANHSHNHQYIGIGTPPSSRCDEKSEKEEEQPLPPPPPQLQQPIATTKQQNGFATHNNNNNDEDGHQPVPMPKQEHVNFQTASFSPFFLPSVFSIFVWLLLFT